MDMTKNFLATMQHSVAVSAIGPSALRNQGESGVIDAARGFLAQLDLSSYMVKKKEEFDGLHNSTTEILVQALPKKAQHWGAARKAINLFLRDILYNRYLAERYQFPMIEELLEIPLDSVVAKGLRKSCCRGELPSWPGLKYLSKEISFLYQTYAEKLANERGIARVHLDMYLWLQER